MGIDEYVILNSDLSFYAPPTADLGMLGRRCAPWVGRLDPTEPRAVLVELDGPLRARFEVSTCSMQATTTATHCHRKVRRRLLAKNGEILLTVANLNQSESGTPFFVFISNHCSVSLARAEPEGA